MLMRLVRQLQNFRAGLGIKKTGAFHMEQGSIIEFRKIFLKPDCSLRIGSHSMIEGSVAFDKAGGVVTIGSRTFIGGSSLVCANKIDVGDDVLLSWGCTIADHDSHSLVFSERSSDVLNWMRGEKDWSHVRSSPIRICDKVWIGFNCIILKGVTIGEGAVVGAGSVVTRDIPPYSVAVGNPARVIRELSADER